MRRPAPPRDIPPPLELECLKALWGLGEGSVRDVRKILVANRNLALHHRHDGARPPGETGRRLQM